LAVKLVTLVVPAADEPRYRPWKAVVASVGSTVDDLMVYEPFEIMPVAVMSDSEFLTAASKL
jgi:hypothetical protein